MDEEAAYVAPDELLQEFGLTAKGDIIALKAHCLMRKTESSEERKADLKLTIANTNRLAGSSKRKYSTKKKTVLLGWLHFNTKKKKYITVSAKHGGGIRSVKLRQNATRHDVLEFAKSVFILDNTTAFGPAHSLTYDIGNFAESSLPEQLLLNGESVKFTLDGYIQKHHLSKTRLYLLTKKKSFVDYFSDESGDDDFFVKQSQHLKNTKSWFISSDSESEDTFRQPKKEIEKLCHEIFKDKSESEQGHGMYVLFLFS